MKILRCAVIVIIFLLISVVPAYAADNNQSNGADNENITGNLESEISGSLNDAIPETAESLLGQYGLNEYNTENLSNFQFTDLFSGIFSNITDYFTSPIKLLCIIAGIIILISLLNSMHANGHYESGLQYFIGISAIMVVLSTPIIECINKAVNAINECSTFMLSFIPVFTGVIAVSGKPTSSIAYSTFLFGAVEVISQISATVLTPLLCIYLGICIVSVINPAMELETFANTIKKIVIWAIGLLLTIFVALLSIQTFITSSADSVTIKTTKFFVGSLIPVFGSALSESLVSLQSCLGYIKQITGSFSVIVVICTFLPTVLEILAMMLVIGAAKIFGSVLSVGKLTDLLQSVSSVLSLLLGLIVCYAIMIIVSTTLVMMISLGM
jgi:stage III sporulation protein AE